MSTNQLIEELERHDYLLPKDILAKVSEEELIREVQEIFEKYPDKIEAEQSFREKYIELVNYLLVSNLHKEEKVRKPLFDKSLITFLLSTPDMA